MGSELPQILFVNIRTTFLPKISKKFPKSLKITTIFPKIPPKSPPPPNLPKFPFSVPSNLLSVSYKNFLDIPFFKLSLNLSLKLPEIPPRSS